MTKSEIWSKESSSAPLTLDTTTPGPSDGGRNSPQPANHEKGSNYLSGWRLHTMSTGLCLGMFLVNFEIPIVSTSIVSITNDLHHFDQSSWIVTAYLLTYTSFMIIIAKFSDVFGRKTMLLLSMFIFTIFSGGCAAAQTMLQLIICRAFQGMGGSGTYSLVMIMLFEMVPPSKWPLYSVLITTLLALSMVLGPVFGGLINLQSQSAWIWIFLLNVPAGVLTMVLLAISIPRNFPNHGSPANNEPSKMKNIDFLGAALLLAAMTLHITGLEQAANSYTWSSAMVLAPLLAGAGLWFVFVVSQWYTSKETVPRQPMFPMRFFKNRVFMGLLALTFLNGAISTTCIIQLPTRFQTANGTTPLQAGIRLIPFSVTIQIGAMAVAALTQKGRLAPIYLAFIAAVGQIIGCVFLSRGPPGQPDWKPLYGLEVLTGTCIGMGIGVVTLMTPYVTEKRDHAVATASIVQFRFLGGATALAIAVAVGNTYLRSNLPSVLAASDVDELFRTPGTIHHFSSGVQTIVRGMFVKSFNLQMRILAGLAGAQFVFSFLLWKTQQILLK